MKYDFGGYATRNDLTCSDGRVIKKDAFKSQNGQTVPLVWNHNHNDVNDVLGLAHLENRKDGVYAYCEFNDTDNGRTAKELVQHGDVKSLSIFANQLMQKGSDVIHGLIREVSLVLAGANPGAFIDDVIAHGEDGSGIIACYDEGVTVFMHSDDKRDDEEKTKDAKDKKKEKSEDDETVEDVFDSLTEKQKTAVYAVIGTIMEDKENNDDSDDNEGGNNKMAMKHNVFENGAQAQDNTLSHADQVAIIKKAKMRTVGTFKNALREYAEENVLQHDATSSGVSSEDISKLFPEYADVRPGAPELITNDQGWVGNVISKVHKSPMSRIRTTQADIRYIDDLKSHGYKKGKQKKLNGNFSLVRRTTDPQTVYTKSALNRDDIVDITDFDYVAYLYSIDRMNLNEDLARAIMIGDGREEGADDKIAEDHIRPIWLDDDLYTIHVDLDITAMKAELQGTNTGANFGDNFVYAEAMVQTLLYAREDYKGTGTPDLYCTPHMANVMLLARDITGRRIYSSKAELATALNVGTIETAEQFANKTRKTSDGKTKKLIAIMVNLQDYSLGATKGGEITHFTQFDIDFNQEKSLLETRCSGALTRVYSAIAIEEDVTDNKSQQTGGLAA
jgi:HK97 family phage prohead protease